MMNSLLQNCHLSFYKNSIIILMYRNCYNKVLFDIYVLRDIVLYAADPQLILDTGAIKNVASRGSVLLCVRYLRWLNTVFLLSEGRCTPENVMKRSGHCKTF